MKKRLRTIVIVLLPICLWGQAIDSQEYTIAEKHSIYSEILDENREIFIHVPKGFWGMDENTGNYPIAIVLDGESQFLHTVAAYDFLSSSPLGNDLVPRTIVVGIPNTNRNRDLTPTKGIIGKDTNSIAVTGGGQNFLKFITTELIPYLDKHFSISSHRTIIGHSLGGLIVFEALLNHSAYFDNYLAIDPGLGYDNESYLNVVLDSLRKCDLKEENLFIAKANTLPTFLDIKDVENDTSAVAEITRTNKKVQSISAKENWKINFLFRDFPDENHFSVPYPATYYGLKFFYQYYPFKEMMDYYHPSYKEKTDLVKRIKQHYQSISMKMGYEIKPMQSYINSWAYGFSHFKRDDLAIDLFDYNIELYPQNPAAYNAKAYFLLNNNKPEDAIKLFEKSLQIKKDESILEILEGLKVKK